MKRRDLYRIVAELTVRLGKRTLLDAAIGGMRDPSELIDELKPLQPVLHQPDALGRIYQAINAPALEDAYRATTRERRKFSDDEIPSVTQLFTPRFVVEHLLQNTLARATAADKLVRDIRILDPACGTMNFGVVAIDLLETMYHEELSRLGPERASVSRDDQIAGSIVQHNLFGIDIDPVALDLAAQTLSIRLRLPVETCRQNLRCADALFDPALPGEFDVVVTNPPYLSARNLAPTTVARFKRRYPAAWRDAYVCFIERSLELVRPGGHVGILAMQSFMFTGAFEKLRRKIADTAAIEQIAHFGPGLFEIGNPGTLQTAAIVLRRETDAGKRESNPVTAIRLIDSDDKDQALRNGTAPVFKIAQRELLSSPRGAWVYWLSSATRDVFRKCRKLGEIAPPRQGLATTDNARFVRYWWEVAPTREDAPYRASTETWFPYVKSGRFRRWFESPRHRVNWADDGREIKASIAQRYPYLNGRWEWVAKNSQFYGRAGVTYSYLTTGAFSARLMPEGAIFDVAGSAIFPDDPLTLLAVLNSSTAHHLLHAVNPTVNFQVGDLAHLPICRERDDELRSLAGRAVELQRKLDAFDETAPEFVSPPPWDGSYGEIVSELAQVERAVNAAVAQMYGFPDDAPSKQTPPAIDRSELAMRWISFAVGRLLGRWGCPREFELIQLRPPDERTVKRIRAELTSVAGEDIAREIERAAGGIDALLAGSFYAWHVKLYHRRPVYFAFGDREGVSLLLHDFAERSAIAEALWRVGGRLPGDWARRVDHGIAVNLAPLAEWVPDRALARKLAEIKEDLDAGRLPWAISPASTRECASRLSRRRPAATPAART